MRRFRAILFWTHLAIGVVAGVVILVMCVTGVALTYEKQMLEWADRGAMPATASGGVPMPPEALLLAASADAGAVPAALTLRSDRRAPATVTFDGNRVRLVDPATGRSLGEPSPRLRQFFRVMTNWHRWLAMEGTGRSTGRQLTGASNLGFLFIVLSGLYLWLPKVLTWVQVQHVLWFRRGLTPKARDFNWHNVIGIWSALPLALVVAGAVPISYGWAGNLVFRLAGEAPPAPNGGGPGAGPGGPRRPGGPEGGAAREGAGRQREGRRAGGGAQGGAAGTAFSAPGLDGAIAAAAAAVPDWRTATVRFAAPAAPYTVAVDAGHGGQPQYRTTFTIDRATSQVTRRETFADLGPGRQWRTWFRFVHTGEYYGLTGQTIAGLVSAGGAVLVYTGVALALRRFVGWRRRRATTKLRTVAA